MNCIMYKVNSKCQKNEVKMSAYEAFLGVILSPPKRVLSRALATLQLHICLDNNVDRAFKGLRMTSKKVLQAFTFWLHSLIACITEVHLPCYIVQW